MSAEPVPSGPWVLRADLDAAIAKTRRNPKDWPLWLSAQRYYLKLGWREACDRLTERLDALTHGRSEDEGEPT